MIVVNGYAFATEEIANLIESVFWKQTHDADLNTVDGCHQAAGVVAAFLSNIGADYHPGGHHPSSIAGQQLADREAAEAVPGAE